MLFFICPTDFLESIIDSTSGQEKYYFSSLGNSVAFDANAIEEIKKIITEKGIREISFVLANDNCIVSDALGNQEFSEIIGLHRFYHALNKNKKRTDVSWRRSNRKHLLLSYHLNNKIKDLKHGLTDLSMDQITISGKIYHREQNSFVDIYSELICFDYVSLN
ncbi:MAG: hypothetical protein AAF587_33970 [Bacteroidota bacterium]